jgi:hypothetical protein
MQIQDATKQRRDVEVTCTKMQMRDVTYMLCNVTVLPAT